MAEVNISINGRVYEIACDNGQEGRVVDLATYIDHKLQQIARSGAAYNDAHLMVLTALVLADELFETRAHASEIEMPVAPAQAAATKEDEQALVSALEKLAKRIDSIATRVQQHQQQAA